jgi:hypothetical protein
MARHSIIRGLMLAMVLLCVAAWVGSYARMFGVTYQDRWLRSDPITLRVFGGYIEYSHMPLMIFQGQVPRSSSWQWVFQTVDITKFQRYLRSFRFHFAGFAFVLNDRGHSLAIPFYFPTILSALLLLFVWRKTKPTYNGKGFPVEPAKAEEK